MSCAVGRGDDDDAVGLGEAVHLDEELVERLLALFVAQRVAAAIAADGVELVDEDDAGLVAARVAEQRRTRDAPTPAYISTKSEPLAEMNGTPASPAIERASSVLPVPGGPTSRMPRGIRPPIDAKRRGLLQEVDDLADLVLRLVHARDVLERDGHLLRVDRARAFSSVGTRPVIMR